MSIVSEADSVVGCTLSVSVRTRSISPAFALAGFPQSIGLGLEEREILCLDASGTPHLATGAVCIGLCPGMFSMFTAQMTTDDESIDV
jgi:hypothetical protein